MKICKRIYNGSPNWIRTSDLPVNSRLLYRWATEEYKSLWRDYICFFLIVKTFFYFFCFLYFFNISRLKIGIF